MPSDSGDPNRRSTKAINTGAPPPEQHQLPCPRWTSLLVVAREETQSVHAPPPPLAPPSFLLPPMPLPPQVTMTSACQRLPLTSHQGGLGIGGESMGNGLASLLSNHPQGPGYPSLGWFGLGIGPALEDVGFGLGRGMWDFPRADGAAVGGGNDGSPWHFEGGEEGTGCFSWPELSISTPGNLLK
ncbi:hypothetical protein F3Y22_tig00111769pilonHSYRG00240 [Hibiscus syriacus]|uniref:Uncharacterized protein n=1 Tax=Hibiscus syriacus TaxID=106335 RepID=A0A6A2YFW9_HIBSY|nr:hypothetical protein F3Y22_tig00111769pilonHSYRG00240 [Hibiscus syriacus]